MVIIDSANMTPREYCASKQSLPFGGYRLRQGVTDWRKVGRGLIAVTDGSSKQYVAPNLIFGVEISDNGEPMIVSYWRDNPGEGIGAKKPYALSTVKYLVATKQIKRVYAPLTYDDMVYIVRSIYPNAFIPDPLIWYLEYGLTYNETTCEINNPHSLV